MKKKEQKKNIDPINTHVGTKIRMRRDLLGVSQAALAKACGIKSQQIIHSYENGINSISASRLFDIARALSVPVSFFYEGVKSTLTASSKQPGFAEDAQQPFIQDDPLTKKETMDLVRAYYSIPDTKLRKRLLEMAKAMADTD